MPTPGEIATADGSFSYRLTEPDLVALGVAARYEGGTLPSATLWTYAQRLVAFRAGSMRNLVLGHSQPLNPKWRSTGVCCAPPGSHPGEECNAHRITYYGDSEYCSASQLRRRAEAAAITRLDQLPRATRELVAKWANGLVANPVPRAIDFANADVSQAFLRRHPEARVVRRAGNWYLAEARSLDWSPSYVTVAGTGAAATGGGMLFTLGIAGAVLAGAWYGVKKAA